MYQKHLYSSRKIIYILLLITTIFAECGNPPMPDEVKLRGRWHFQYDPDRIGIRDRWYADNTNFSTWETVPSNGYWDKQYDGWGWYSQEIYIPAMQSGQHLALVITSVDDNAKVWLNNSLVAIHEGSGELFHADITKIYNPDKENRITIMVDDIGGPGGLDGEVYLRKYLNEVDLLKGKYYDAKSIESPEWVHNAIVYEIFVRDFSKDGDFSGVINRLDYLKNLGVNTLWLMPIHPIGKVHRKGALGSPYSVKDYYAVNPDFGTEEDFKNLVNAAHEKGMHILIDMVLNHSAWDNPLFQEHPNWYTQDEKGNIVSPNADWGDVANFNYDNQELRRYMIDMLKYWVQDFDVDGFRFDVAGMVPMDFWVQARKELEQVDPDIFFLSEGSQPVMHITAFDATYSWNLYWGLMHILQESKPVSMIEEVMKREEYKYPRDAIQMRFTENHDEQRAAKMLTKPQAFAAAAFANTIPGIPLLYNGQEIGATQRLELFNKTDIEWNQTDEDYLLLYKELFTLRKSHPAIIKGDFNFVTASPEESVSAFTRSTGNETLLMIFNFSDKSEFAELELDNPVKTVEQVLEYGSNLGQEESGNSVSFNISAYGWGVYRINH